MPTTKLESAFQAKFIRELRKRLPEDECFILKNDAGYLTGIFDFTVLLPGLWVGIEFKRSSTSSYQPNQQYYIQRASNLSLGFVVSPENEEDVLREICAAYESCRQTRFS